MPPARSIVVLGKKAIVVCVLQDIDHFDGASRGFALFHPGERVSGIAIEGVGLRAHI